MRNVRIAVIGGSCFCGGTAMAALALALATPRPDLEPVNVPSAYEPILLLPEEVEELPPSYTQEIARYREVLDLMDYESELQAKHATIELTLRELTTLPYYDERFTKDYLPITKSKPIPAICACEQVTADVRQRIWTATRAAHPS
jgi:hypothetical protein